MDEYRSPGFRLKAVIKGIFGNSKARVIRLVRTQKNGMRLLWRSVSELLRQEGAVGERFILRRDADFPASGDSACSVSRCGRVKQEELEWLSRNPFYTKRFAFFVERKYRSYDRRWRNR